MTTVLDQLKDSSGNITKESVCKAFQEAAVCVEYGVKLVHEYQTGDEQLEKITAHSNGVGFNGTDAEFLSDMAEKVNKGWHLTEKQLFWTRKKMIKYAGQVARILNGRGG